MYPSPFLSARCSARLALHPGNFELICRNPSLSSSLLSLPSLLTSQFLNIPLNCSSVKATGAYFTILINSSCDVNVVARYL
ncbi:hypothetical protein LguiA_006658 [Lonicera macranthoides]